MAQEVRAEIERARSLLASAAREERGKELCIAAATLLETVDRAHARDQRPPSVETLRAQARRFDERYAATANRQHSEILCNEALRCRERAGTYLETPRRHSADAWLALRSAANLYEKALEIGKTPPHREGDRQAPEMHRPDLERTRRRVDSLKAEYGEDSPRVGMCLLELELVEQAFAVGLPEIGAASMERIRRVLDAVPRKFRDRGPAQPRELHAELERLDDLLALAAPHIEGFPRRQRLYDRALEHRQIAIQAMRAERRQEAHRHLADGTRLALRLLEESPGVRASRVIERVADLLVVAGERVAAAPPDPRLNQLLNKATRLQQEAEQANQAGRYSLAEKSGHRAEDLLFNILSLTR